MASDLGARAGGEIDGLAEANGAVLATLWEEATEEHGGDVFGGWPWAEMGDSANKCVSDDDTFCYTYEGQTKSQMLIKSREIM